MMAINDELRRIHMTVAVPYLKVLFQHYSGGSEEIHEKREDRKPISQDLNSGPLKHKAQVLAITP
jgi:hypothetical protein